MNVQATVAASRPVAKPPFRAEHIGSLLRPPELLAERMRFARGAIDQAALTAAEDAAIRGAIRLQEELGFKFVTDGEFRRRSYHSFFYRQLGELSIDTIDGADAKGAQNGGGRGAQPVAVVGSRVVWTHPINAGDVAFLKANCDRVPKITIPGPCALHFRGGDAAVLASAYTDLDQFWADTIEAYQGAARALSGRLPLCADRRNRLCKIRGSGRASRARRARRPVERAHRCLYRCDQSCAAGCSGRAASRHASVPRQSRRPLACRRQL